MCLIVYPILTLIYPSCEYIREELAQGVGTYVLGWIIYEGGEGGVMIMRGWGVSCYNIFNEGLCAKFLIHIIGLKRLTANGSSV